MTDWVITLPQDIEWEDYQKELKTVSGYGFTSSEVMNYRLPYKPKAARGDRCWLVWRGKVRGWMKVVGVEHYPEGFQCSTTGQMWRPGWYLQRAGLFREVDGPDMQGFRGLRKLDYYRMNCVGCDTPIDAYTTYHASGFLQVVPCPKCERSDGVVFCDAI